jgi:hypothetical protein
MLRVVAITVDGCLRFAMLPGVSNRGMTQRIRAATASDAAAVLELWRDAESEPTHTDDTASITKLVSRDPGALLVAEESRPRRRISHRWVGWVAGIDLQVGSCATSPAPRPGRRLLVEAERRMVELGAIRLQAIVAETDLLATSFWTATDWDEQVERLRFTKG